MKSILPWGILFLALTSASAQVFQVDNSGNVISTGAVTSQSGGLNSSGSGAGQLALAAGAAPTTAASNAFILVAQPSITAFQNILPTSAVGGLWRGTTATGASATVTIMSGVVTGYSALSGGSGYTLPPVCTITTTGSGTGAGCTTTLMSGAVNGITITGGGGTGYNTGVTSFNFTPQLTMSSAELSGDATTTAANANQVKVVGIQTVAVSGVEGSVNKKVQLSSQTTATTANDIAWYDGSGNVSDSGTAISSLATLAGPTTFTGTTTVATLAATTINGAALSGTFTGAPTLSGNVAFTGAPTFTSLNQPTGTTPFGGTCTTSTTSCNVTLGHSYSSPVCIATEQGSSGTVRAGICSVSGTTATVTASSSGTNITWGVFVFGNPN